MRNFLLFLSLVVFQCSAIDPISSLFCGFSATLGPEFYYLKRCREGRSKQSGWMYGASFSFDRIHKGALYLNVNGYKARGRPDGDTAGGRRLESILTDAEIEGRVGYTFGALCPKWLLFTPYGGYGVFYGVNKVRRPKEAQFRFADRFDYAAAGLLLRTCCWESFSIGLNFKAQWMLEGRETRSDDPFYKDSTAKMTSQWQYEAQMPLVYYANTFLCGSNVQLTPFWRHHHYGGRENFPFDFRETTFRIYGIKLLLGYTF